MDKQRLYLSPPHISEEEIDTVTEILKNGWIAPVGRELDRFEIELQQRFGFPRVLCLQSGTAALHLAVKLAGVSRGDKVLIGTFTYVAAANAVLYEGGIPVFLDSDAATWNLDPDLLSDYLETTTRTGDTLPKAVILTHIFGKPARVDAIKSICQRYDIKLIEDAAEALGAEYREKYMGNWADYGVLSFNGNKILTTGGGGALICRNDADYQKAKYWATQSRENVSWYTHREVGYNYRLSNVLAGVGLAQLTRFETVMKRKRTIMEYYMQHLPGEVFDFPAEIEGGSSNCWLTTILIKKEFLDQITPKEAILSLERENIEGRMFWKPLHCQPLFKDAAYAGELRIAEDLFQRGLCLPSGIGISGEDQHRAIECILRTIRG